MVAELCQIAGDWAIPILLLTIPLIGYGRGVRVYESFIEGASDGVRIALRLLPYLIAILVAVNVFRASGAMDKMTALLESWISVIGVPAELVPLMILRPFSGSAALGIMSDILTQFGADSLLGLMASTVMGSTDTTFYIISVYLGAVGIAKARYALFVGLCGDVIGFLLSVWLCHRLFG